MVYAYYHKLSAEGKRIYRRSDSIIETRLPDAAGLQHLVPLLISVLEREDRRKAEETCGMLALGITSMLSLRPVRVRVLAVRPSASWGELHGLYEPAGGRSAAIITLWMRTARKKRVVAFRSFLRTLLHELCHHLDYELYRLPDSLHTEGFYKRESSLFHQLVPDPLTGKHPPP